MQIANNTPTRTPGQKLTAAERSDLIADMVQLLLDGVYSDRELARRLMISHTSVAKLRPHAVKIISNTAIDRNAIRSLQLQRAYDRLERLNADLEEADSVQDKMKIHAQITKLEQRIDLISGLNVETKVNINHKKLVITRAHPADVQQAQTERKAIEADLLND